MQTGVQPGRPLPVQFTASPQAYLVRVLMATSKWDIHLATPSQPGDSPSALARCSSMPLMNAIVASSILAVSFPLSLSSTSSTKSHSTMASTPGPGVMTRPSANWPSLKSSHYCRLISLFLPASHASKPNVSWLKTTAIFKSRRFSAGGNRAKHVISRYPW